MLPFVTSFIACVCLATGQWDAALLLSGLYLLGAVVSWLGDCDLCSWDEADEDTAAE